MSEPALDVGRPMAVPEAEWHTIRQPQDHALLRFLRVLLRNYATALGLAIIVVMIVVALVGPVLAPYKYDEVILTDRLQPPSAEHLLGTDQFGRDILSRMLFGARVSLVVGLGGVAVAMAFGVVLGAIAGFYGRWPDEIIMRLMDILLAFPYIILAVALIAMVGPSVRNIILVVGFTRLPQFARLVRGSVLTIRETDFVTAARAIGQREWRILSRHILPNCLTPIVVMASLSVATAILTESALSFLGLGIQPPQSSWGTMIADGRRFMLDAPWIATFPGIAISLTILGYNLLGDGLRDALDPRLRTRE
ncbi:MAG: ABC transporter permease [Ardenticatenaceae bacterium]|nr:ABC transporter permease [Ardenticatenaceae bacterium]